MKQQVRCGKKDTLQRPTMKQILEMGTRAVDCVRAMSEKDVPNGLVTDWNELLPYTKLTPLGYAYALKKLDIAAVLKKLGAALISPGASNPVHFLMEWDKSSLEQNTVLADYLKDLLVEYPELQISGDERGACADTQMTYRPHFEIHSASQLPTLMMLHGIGISLDETRNNVPLIAAIWRAGVEVVQYILDNTPPDPLSCEKALREMFIVREFRISIITVST